MNTPKISFMLDLFNSSPFELATIAISLILVYIWYVGTFYLSNMLREGIRKKTFTKNQLIQASHYILFVFALLALMTLLDSIYLFKILALAFSTYVVVSALGAGIPKWATCLLVIVSSLYLGAQIEDVNSNVYEYLSQRDGFHLLEGANFLFLFTGLIDLLLTYKNK